MQYRRVGRSGLKVSVLAFGTATFPGEVKSAREFLAAAFDAGVNFIDTAEVYLASEAERALGAALQTLKPPRLRYVIATKFGVGLDQWPNENNTLNRKYLMHAIDGSLQRLGHLAIAWCLANAHICSVALGGSRLSQLTANLQALEVLPKLTQEVRDRLDAALGGYSSSWRPVNHAASVVNQSN